MANIRRFYKRALRKDYFRKYTDTTMKMHICICGDEIKFSRELELELIRYSFQANCDFYVTMYKTPGELLRSTIDFDVIFIDIRFYGEDKGIALAQKLRENGNKAYIIFISSLPGYMQDGHKAAVFRYLIKPIKRKELHDALGAVMKKLEEPNNPLRFVVHIGVETRIINIEKLKFIESVPTDRCRHIICLDEEIIVRETLEKLFKRLPPKQFAYIHQSFLVNLSFVKGIKESTVFLTSGDRLPVGRTYKKHFLLVLQQFSETSIF